MHITTGDTINTVDECGTVKHGGADCMLNKEGGLVIIGKYVLVS